MNPHKALGLENQMTDIKVGDRICLRDANLLEVSGYVLWLTPKKVRLSMESPDSKNRGLQARLSNYRNGIINGDRTYNLSKFDSFYKLVRG
ncbi:MAG: hypothetical protein WC796_02175 [Candidatus Pacearchaeota archaeon]|jgi:hypothetical protein